MKVTIMLWSFRALNAKLFSNSLPNHIIRKPSRVRFAQAVSGPNQPGTSDKIEQTMERNSKTGEENSLSGERGYAKRSDEEGYGAEYGGNESLSKEDEEKIVHGNAPEYDPSERSS